MEELDNLAARCPVGFTCNVEILGNTYEEREIRLISVIISVPFTLPNNCVQLRKGSSNDNNKVKTMSVSMKKNKSMIIVDKVDWDIFETNTKVSVSYLRFLNKTY